LSCPDGGLLLKSFHCTIDRYKNCSEEIKWGKTTCFYRNIARGSHLLPATVTFGEKPMTVKG